MVSGLAGAIVLAVLGLRALRKRVVRPVPMIRSVKASAALPRATA
jgi:hypothetical protein